MTEFCLLDRWGDSADEATSGKGQTFLSPPLPPSISSLFVFSSDEPFHFPDLSCETILLNPSIFSLFSLSLHPFLHPAGWLWVCRYISHLLSSCSAPLLPPGLTSTLLPSFHTSSSLVSPVVPSAFVHPLPLSISCSAQRLAGWPAVWTVCGRTRRSTCFILKGTAANGDQEDSGDKWETESESVRAAGGGGGSPCQSETSQL